MSTKQERQALILIKEDLEVLRDYCAISHFSLIVIMINKIIEQIEKLCEEF